jgi:hypothetical protein
MTHPHERALEAAYEAAAKVRLHLSGVSFNDPQVAESFRELIRAEARAAVTAYQAAMPPPVSPELIAKLNALASRLTEQGEYEAVDLIDTVVARVIDAAPPAAQEPRP